MSVRNSRLSLALALLLSLTACDLSENAQKSADNSGMAAQNSTQLLDLSANAYGDGRQKGSRESRENALNFMFGAKRLEAKLVGAAAFFTALEYQTWKADGFREDNAAKRDRLITSAVSETLKTQKDFIKVDWKNEEQAKSLAGLLAKLTQESYAGQNLAVSTLNAFAFAASLHTISERQSEAALRYKFKAKSMLDIFSEILIAKHDAESDPVKLSQQPGYVYEGLRASDEISELLQLRMNLMMLTAAGLLSPSVAVSKEGGVEIKGTAVQFQDAIDRMKAALQVKLVLSKAEIELKTFADAKGGLAQWTASVQSLSGDNKVASTSPMLSKLQEARDLAALLTQ